MNAVPGENPMDFNAGERKLMESATENNRIAVEDLIFNGCPIEA